jgi:topoisomerase IA-like protein
MKLADSPRVKATANIALRDKRVKQAMIIKVFSGRAGSWIKDGRTGAKVPTK